VRLVRAVPGTDNIDGIFVSDEFETDETVFWWNNATINRSTNGGDRFIV
jgi:hypothetical protein